MPNITIHGKRVETIYAFTVEYKGQEITGRYIRVNEVDEDEPIPLEDEEIQYDGERKLPEHWIVKDNIKQAIKDYEKTR